LLTAQPHFFSFHFIYFLFSIKVRKKKIIVKKMKGDGEMGDEEEEMMKDK